jgi:endonuclease/exonuclease/phosphatase (EEP) superfamily protein YafD
MAQATVDMPFGPTTVIAVHTWQPLANVTALRAQLAALGEVVSETDGPLILAGDFNASRQHAPFRALLDTGLTDAHLATGRGWAASWPVGARVPPFALIDHVLVSDQLAVDEVGEVPVPASDHRALVATVGSAAPD